MCIVPRMLFTDELPVRAMPTVEEASNVGMEVDAGAGLDGGYVPQEVAA